MRFRGPAAVEWVAVVVEPLTAVYHRRSGLTHLLVEPAPQLLEVLAGATLTLASVRERLAAAYDLPDLSDDGLAQRLSELVETGLVERV